MSKTQQHPELGGEPTPETSAAEPSADDFYMEGPYVVFTAAYHIKRGFCCNSNCRHCPYQ